MQLTLQHTRQPFPWGCQYYSLYSLLGDERILEDVTESNGHRFEERARQLGYFLSWLYCDCSCSVPMPESVWQKLFGGTVGVEVLQGHVGPFLIDVRSPRNQHVMHTVAIALRASSETELSVQVFDPCAAGEKEFCTLADFLASPYGRVYGLKQVLSLTHYEEVMPKAFGPDAAHVRPEVREAYNQSLLEKEAA
jgi:hypothetical protein